MKTDTASPPIYVQNPRRLPLWRLPAERAPLGVSGDYKPNVALLPSGELIVVAYCSIRRGDGVENRPIIWRSSDGGRSWSDREAREDVAGGEPYLTATSRGTLLLTSCLSVDDPANEEDGYIALLHRSTDGGRSWERMKVTFEDEHGRQRTVPVPNRNFIELPDGTIQGGISMRTSPIAHLWSSRDDGKTWSQGAAVAFDDYGDRPFARIGGFFAEDFTLAAHGGKLLHWVRIGPTTGNMYPMDDDRPPPFGSDNVDRALLGESHDGGQTWINWRDFGDYGVLYPRCIRLRDGRLLATYTQRSLFLPLGLRAVLSDDDGETWDFENDLIIIDGKTPPGAWSGGGFGNTVQLDDDTLVSCYSYRDKHDQTHVEAARWLLPVSDTRPFFFDRRLLDMADPGRRDLLYDWSDDSAVEVLPCNYPLEAGKIHANVSADTTTVNGEPFLARIEFLSAAEAETEEIAVALRNLPITDWRDYLAVALRLHNATDEPQEVTITVREADGVSCHRSQRFEPGQTATLFMEIAEARTRISMDDIGKLKLSVLNPPTRQTFLVGPVCLIK